MTTDAGVAAREGASSDVSVDQQPPRGRFYVLEGIDGAGKSTVARSVSQALVSQTGREVVLTSEPTDSWLGDCVRRAHGEALNAVSETLLFIADRATHTDAIRGWIERGMIVLSDRYYASTLAYQGAMLKPVLGRKAVDWLRMVNEPIIVRPDLTFLLSLPPESGIGRLASRTGRTKFEKLEFLREVDRIYTELARNDETYVVVDAMLPVESVAEVVLSAIKGNL